jgi:hypothetical protein
LIEAKWMGDLSIQRSNCGACVSGEALLNRKEMKAGSESLSRYTAIRIREVRYILILPASTNGRKP